VKVPRPGLLATPAGRVNFEIEAETWVGPLRDLEALRTAARDEPPG
jgi:hypothetical protein